MPGLALPLPPRVDINRRNSPLTKRKFQLLNGADDTSYGPAQNVGNGYAFAIFAQATDAAGTNTIQIEAKTDGGNWALWKEISVSAQAGLQVLPVIEAISAVSMVRARLTPYNGGTFDLRMEVMLVKTYEVGQAPETIDWSNLTNVPTSFAPEAHTHDAESITGTGMPLFLATVTGLTGGGATNLDGIATAGGAVGTNSMRILVIGDSLQFWRLVASTAAENAAGGIVRPDDYDGSTNARVWVRLL